MHLPDKEWAGFFAALAWVVLVGCLALAFGNGIRALLWAVATRIKDGGTLAWGAFSLGSPPKELPTSKEGVVTAEGPEGSAISAELSNRVDRASLPRDVTTKVHLVHFAEVVRPRVEGRKGLYRVRVVVESWEPSEFDRVYRVTYLLDETFKSRRLIATQDADSNFELWLSIYGEIEVAAYIEFADCAPVWLTRYLDLPGRPPD